MLACASLALLGASPARSAKPGPNVAISEMTARFFPAVRETRYGLHVTRLNGNTEPLHMTWTLTLELVDKAGAPNPGTVGSGAAVDLGCTNANVGLPAPAIAPDKDTLSEFIIFVWHHPDPPDSVPVGKYHCNHADMGPRGHQGLITFVVSDKQWRCTATYKGTNSSTGKSVKDGTASEPTCRRLAG